MLLADLPVDVAEAMPSYLWAGVLIVVLLLAVLLAGYWGMFGLPCRKPKYRGRRRVDRRNPDQLRPAALPASTLPPLPRDDVEVIAVGEPLAIESGPADVIEGPQPWWAEREFQHREEVSR